jgi:hypothetical protein
MKRTLSLYLRTLFGLPPKVTYMKSFDVICYLRAIGYRGKHD